MLCIKPGPFALRFRMQGFRYSFGTVHGRYESKLVRIIIGAGMVWVLIQAAYCFSMELRTELLDWGDLS